VLKLQQDLVGRGIWMKLRERNIDRKATRGVEVDGV
jgi:hypothetical protein